MEKVLTSAKSLLPVGRNKFRNFTWAGRKINTASANIPFRRIEQIQLAVLDDSRTRPTSAGIIRCSGSKRNGQFFPIQKILGAGVSPVHRLLPRNGIVGRVLIKNVIISFKIYQPVGIVHPSPFGLVMISEGFCVVHILFLLVWQRFNDIIT